MTGQKKHVIFLGAGASCTSGYPIGQQLRLRLCSRSHFSDDLDAVLKTNPSNPSRNIAKFRELYLEYFDQFKDVIDLFRHGGFATVDEFSKLASSRYPEMVQHMKRFMRLAFTFHNPEATFHDSDYYPFLQRLFQDDLFTLRQDITVISYNYDCYLDFLLMKAFELRKKLSDDSSISPDERNALSSGFFDPSSIQWTRVTGFKYMKLHGSIAYVKGEDFSHEKIFSPEITKRIPTTYGGYDKTSVPPIVFPWELFEATGKFISESEFIFFKNAKTNEQKAEARTLFNQYEAIWERARSEVQHASKISFVGISMHDYMKQGLAHLFNGKAGDAELVIANKENGDFPNVEGRLHPGTFSGRTARLLKSVAPVINPVQSSSETPDSHTIQLRRGTGVTLHKTFKEFIEKEMV